MASPPTADVLFHNGRVLTVDGANSIQQAIAVRGGMIRAVGTNDEVLALRGPGTTAINLGGRTLIPGIIDIHAHMDREGLKEICPSLAGAHSTREIVSIVQRLVSAARPGEWIVTMPIGDPPNYADVPGQLVPPRYPTRRDLDAVSPDNPVYIRGIWTPWNVPPSVAVANSMALKVTGINRDTPSPDPTITIERDATGEPTGVLYDHNRFPALEFTLMRMVPRFTHLQRVAGLKSAMKAYNAAGTTGIYEGHGVAPEVLDAYKDLWDTREMTVRSRLVLSPTWKTGAEAARELDRWAHSVSGQGFGDDMLRIGGVYIGYGGSQFTAQARMSQLPFTGWAGFVDSYHSPPLFRRLVSLCARRNLRVHTIVRGLMEEVLGTFEAVDEETPIDGKRWVLEHVLDTTPSQLRRIRRLGLVIETIPLTELWLRGGAALRDPEVAERATAHRSYSDHGVPFGMGTDNKPLNPFMTLWSAVARKERTSGDVLGANQRIDRMAALRALTMGGAYFSFDESLRGSLEPGKQADIAVLSDDFLEMDVDRLVDLTSELTMVNGRIVHRTGAV